jgi:hypothetical protein
MGNFMTSFVVGSDFWASVEKCFHIYYTDPSSFEFNSSDKLTVRRSTNSLT